MRKAVLRDAKAGLQNKLSAVEVVLLHLTKSRAAIGTESSPQAHLHSMDLLGHLARKKTENAIEHSPHSPHEPRAIRPAG